MFYRISLILASLFVITACSNSAGDESGRSTQNAESMTEVNQPSSEASKGSLLFFMNPNGRPCQMQDQYLNDARNEIEALANIVYVKTTDDRDRPLFYQYGIRSLPVMIVLNEDQQEVRRFSPGIQQPQTVLDVLKSVL